MTRARATVAPGRDPLALSPWPCAAPARLKGQSAISEASRTVDRNVFALRRRGAAFSFDTLGNTHEYQDPFSRSYSTQKRVHRHRGGR
jgi:hypothetical protein